MLTFGLRNVSNVFWVFFFSLTILWVFFYMQLQPFDTLCIAYLFFLKLLVYCFCQNLLQNIEMIQLILFLAFQNPK